MEIITVTKYGSQEDRNKKENGIPLGKATSYREFTELVGQGAYAFLGYTAENNQALHYQQVEQRFGRKFTHFDEENEEC